MPCSEKRARLLLQRGRARVVRIVPFTIRLVDRLHEQSEVRPLRLKIDPGSKVSGLALIDDAKARVLWGADLEHRGHQIHQRMLARRQLRRARRYRKTRYRKPRFLNRRRPEGWLPPSLESRVQNIMTWVARLGRWAPVGSISVELVKFDTQKLQNPEISGVEYQRGELFGYEVREYLLEKWGRRCAYCGATNVPLEIEHIIPKGRGGTDRVSNLTLACHACNLKKGTQTAAEFGHPEVYARARLPLRDAAAVNTTRWTLYHRLLATGLPVEIGSGGQTKYRRTRLGLPKEHWLDAACVGKSTPEALRIDGILPLRIIATGRGHRQMCRPDRYGFPVRHRARPRRFLGFRTGDLVKATVARGKYAGVYTGRVIIRFQPCFQVGSGINIHPRYLKLLQRADGYEYERGKIAARSHLQVGASVAA